jgi:hypothetical protein
LLGRHDARAVENILLPDLNEPGAYGRTRRAQPSLHALPGVPREENMTGREGLFKACRHGDRDERFTRSEFV